MTPAIRPADQKPGLFDKLGAGMTQLWQSGAINRFFRLIAIGIALVLLVFVLLATVLWNADFYTARDHWEHFKIAMFSPWQKAGTLLSLREEPQSDAAEVVKAQVNVLVDIVQCEDNWCQVRAQGQQGWLRANMLWGIYPDEAIAE